VEPMWQKVGNIYARASGLKFGPCDMRRRWSSAANERDRRTRHRTRPTTRAERRRRAPCLRACSRSGGRSGRLGRPGCCGVWELRRNGTFPRGTQRYTNHARMWRKPLPDHRILQSPKHPTALTAHLFAAAGRGSGCAMAAARSFVLARPKRKRPCTSTAETERMPLEARISGRRVTSIF
jgi:hypothetical protein